MPRSGEPPLTPAPFVLCLPPRPLSRRGFPTVLGSRILDRELDPGWPRSLDGVSRVITIPTTRNCTSTPPPHSPRVL
eukprot:2300288-Pyramimonas_sp.AAC.1